MNRSSAIFVLFSTLGLLSAAKNAALKNPKSTTTSPFENATHMCRGLQSLEIDSFMRETTSTFQYECALLERARESDYQNLYKITLTIAGYKISFAHKNSTNLCVKDNSTIFLLEFTVSRTGREALERTERYRQNFSHDTSNRDVLCLGINYKHSWAIEPPGKVNLSCDWAASLYFANGTLKKEYSPQSATLSCI